MRILLEISYKKFCSIKNSCFPEELIDEQVYLNNVSDHQFLFAEDDEFTRGYLLFDLKTYPARLVQLCVTKGYRSHGIGSFLMSHLKKLLLELEVPKIILNVNFENHSAIKFYLKHGFVKESTNTQFSYHSSEKLSTKDSKISISEINDINTIQEELHTGQSMTKYISESVNNTLYSINNQKEMSIGHFLFDLDQLKISYFIFDNPEMMNDLIILFSNIVPKNTDLLIESRDHDIDDHMIDIPGITTEYKLQIMKFCAHTKTNQL